MGGYLNILGEGAAFCKATSASEVVPSHPREFDWKTGKKWKMTCTSAVAGWLALND